MSLKVGERIVIPFNITAALLSAGGNLNLVAPVDGYVGSLRTIVQVAIVTGGTLTLKSGSALATTVAGISNVIADSATEGTIVESSATLGSSTRQVTKGQRIAIVIPAAFNGGGELNGYLSFHTADISPAAA